MLELARVSPGPAQQIDGVSLVPLLEGRPIAPRPLFWHYPHYGNQGGEPSSIIRQGDWKLIHYWEDGHNELYNLATDIGEKRDLAQTEPRRADGLWTTLQAWLRETNAPVPQPNPEYQPIWAGQQRDEALSLKMKLEQQHARFLNPDWQPDPAWWGSLVPKD
jgi:hypothetical protein